MVKTKSPKRNPRRRELPKRKMKTTWTVKKKLLKRNQRKLGI